MILTVVGCGDAFASGGRLTTCFHLQHAEVQLLLDCGVTSLLGMRRQGFRSAEIDYIVLSHFHGDHYGGVPFVLLDALVTRRTQPLTIVSPPGGRERIARLTECLYPGVMPQVESAFPIHYLEFGADMIQTPHFQVQAVSVIHSPESLPHAVRLEWSGKIIAFSGDTEWTEALLPIADRADLFICECNHLDTKGPGHISYRVLQQQLPRMHARQTVLTHLGEAMLNHTSELDWPCLEDGQRILL